MAVWTTTRLVNTGTGSFNTSSTSTVVLDTVPAATVWSISKFMLEMKLSGSGGTSFNFYIQAGPIKIFDTNGTITINGGNNSITFPQNGVVSSQGSMKGYMDLCQPHNLASSGGAANHNSIILKASDAIQIVIATNNGSIIGTYAIMGMQYA